MSESVRRTMRAMRGRFWAQASLGPVHCCLSQPALPLDSQQNLHQIDAKPIINVEDKEDFSAGRRAGCGFLNSGAASTSNAASDHRVTSQARGTPYSSCWYLCVPRFSIKRANHVASNSKFELVLTRIFVCEPVRGSDSAQGSGGDQATGRSARPHEDSEHPDDLRKPNSGYATRRTAQASDRGGDLGRRAGGCQSVQHLCQWTFQRLLLGGRSLQTIDTMVRSEDAATEFQAYGRSVQSGKPATSALFHPWNGSTELTDVVLGLLGSAKASDVGKQRRSEMARRERRLGSRRGIIATQAIQRLGLKVFGGQTIPAGGIIVPGGAGTRFQPGAGTLPEGKDDTLFRPVGRVSSPSIARDVASTCWQLLLQLHPDLAANIPTSTNTSGGLHARRLAFVDSCICRPVPRCPEIAGGL